MASPVSASSDKHAQLVDLVAALGEVEAKMAILQVASDEIREMMRAVLAELRPHPEPRRLDICGHEMLDP